MAHSEMRWITVPAHVPAADLASFGGTTRTLKSK
jgi:hypothetical protein